MSGPTIRSLRILIAAEWILTIVAVPLAFLLEPSLPPELRKFLAVEQERPFSLRDAFQSVAMLLSMALWLGGSIGVFLLRRWARHVYLAAAATGVIVTPFVGPTLLAPLVAA